MIVCMQAARHTQMVDVGRFWETQIGSLLAPQWRRSLPILHRTCTRLVLYVLKTAPRTYVAARCYVGSNIATARHLEIRLVVRGPDVLRDSTDLINCLGFG
jgi:hypothetical protein